MNTVDMALLLGYMASAWTLGFCGGFLLTRFKDALSLVA